MSQIFSNGVQQGEVRPYGGMHRSRSSSVEEDTTLLPLSTKNLVVLIINKKSFHFKMT